MSKRKPVKCYVSSVVANDERDGFKEMTVSRLLDGKELFTLTESHGCGDYRGFPANIWQSAHDDAYSNISEQLDEDVREGIIEDWDWDDIADRFGDHEGAIQDFALIRNRKKPFPSNERYAKDDPYGWDFIAWFYDGDYEGDVASQSEQGYEEWKAKQK